MYNIFLTGLKNRKLEEKCLPVSIKKQIPMLKAGLLGSESQEFCTLNKFLWGYQQTPNFRGSSPRTTASSGMSSSLTVMEKLINKLVGQCFPGHLVWGVEGGEKRDQDRH